MCKLLNNKSIFVSTCLKRKVYIYCLIVNELEEMNFWMKFAKRELFFISNSTQFLVPIAFTLSHFTTYNRYREVTAHGVANQRFGTR